MKVIYHANCIDGFTAAWCVWRQLGVEAEYVPAKHGDEPPDVRGQDVVILDFSYPREKLIRLHAEARSLRVFDHHKTAEADLAGLDFCTFDMNRSGAGLAWDKLRGSVRPALVSYVEDRDLWRFALPDSAEINAWIGSWEQSFEVWDSLDADLTANFGACRREGSAVLRGVQRYCREMAKQARHVEFNGYTVPIVNAPYINTSELVGYLAEHPQGEGRVPFAVGWFQRGDGKYQYSLRSRGDYDVSEVAKKYGGGGHRNAAGFVSDELVHI